MASYIPAKKNADYIFCVSLPSQVNPKVFQVSPTLAAGDVKVSTDFGTAANITTLPVVTPAGSKTVKVTLNASEMNGDNVQVVFSDVAGSEWCDVTINIPTSGKLLEELASEAGGNVTAIKAKTDNLPANPAAQAKLDTIEGLAVGASGFAAIKGQTAAIETDTQDLQNQIGIDGAGLTALGDTRIKLLDADVVVDTGTTPWELVWLEKDSGGLGVGTELLRKEIRDVDGDPITSAMVVPGRQVST